jgi:thioredoxin 1
VIRLNRFLPLVALIRYAATTRNRRESMGKALKKIGKINGRKAPGGGPVREIRGDKDFERSVLEAEGPVIVDFWAPWCAPCRAMAPVFDAAARKHKGQVRFVKVNTEANPSLARSFEINSIPSLLVFLNGEIIDARIGLTSGSQLDAILRRALDKHHGVGAFGKLKRMFGGNVEPAEA